MDEIKQKAIDALEILKEHLLENWELDNASKIDGIILQIKELD